MRNLLNFNYIYIVAVFLAIGCAKESLSPDPSDAVLALSLIDNPETPDPDPEVDCKCYMRVIGVEEVGSGDFWRLITGGNIFKNGLGANWFEPGPSGPLFPLPSPFTELPSPSIGWHSFILEFPFGVSTNPLVKPLIYTEVRCYLQNGDGTETLMTTTYHTFDFWEGNQVPLIPANIARSFNKIFSCLVLTDPPPRD